MEDVATELVGLILVCIVCVCCPLELPTSHTCDTNIWFSFEN